MHLEIRQHCGPYFLLVSLLTLFECKFLRFHDRAGNPAQSLKFITQAANSFSKTTFTMRSSIKVFL